MINIHLYPSQIRNESRILREVSTISGLGIFDAIDIVGTGGFGLASDEHVADGIMIRRLGIREGERSLPGKVVDALRWSWEVYRRYRARDVGCVNCHSIATLPVGCAVKWSTGARLVYDTHELETETIGLRGIRKLATKVAERMLIGYADFCIFVGAAIESWYRDRYKLDDTAVVYNAPKYEEAEAADEFRRIFSIARSVPIFLYQGVLSEARGIPKLVAAFSTLEETALVVMGYGDLAEWVECEARDRSNVHFHPAVPPSELGRYTRSADYGLSVIEAASLSYEYCMPNKLFEYLMAGKPVLVSPTREQRVLVEGYGVGVVLESTSIESIRRGVRELLGRDKSAMSSAMARVRREFSWEQQENVLREIYVERLGLAPRREPAGSGAAS